MYSEVILKKFWAKVDKKEPEECWNWIGGKTTAGYGMINVSGQRIYTHRFSLQVKLNRKIMEGLVAKHACDNPSCVNPNHLSEGTQSENTRESFDRKRHIPKKGSEHGRSKLTETDVLEIRKIYEETPLTQRQIAELYGIADRSVSKIINKELWAHI